MHNFSLLSSTWVEWNDLSHIPASVMTDCPDCEISFVSDAQSFHLRREGDWWVIDETDDRRKRYNETAQLSNFALVEKYLLWRWGSFMRIVLGLPLSGPQLFRQGYSGDVSVKPATSPWRTEITSPVGSAVLSQTDSTIFSHFISRSVDEIAEMAREGFPT